MAIPPQFLKNAAKKKVAAKGASSTDDANAKPDGFNPFAAGNKAYGGGRPFPTKGPVNPVGHNARDRKQAVQKAAMSKLAALKKGK